MVLLPNDNNWQEAALNRAAPAAPAATKGPSAPAASRQPNPGAMSLGVNVAAAIGRSATSNPTAQMAIDVAREFLSTGKVDVLGRAKNMGLAAITQNLANALGPAGYMLGAGFGGAVSGAQAGPQAAAQGAIGGLGSAIGGLLGAGLGPVGSMIGASLGGYFAQTQAAHGFIGDALGSRTLEDHRDFLEDRGMTREESRAQVEAGRQSVAQDIENQQQYKGASLAEHFGFGGSGDNSPGLSDIDQESGGYGGFGGYGGGVGSSPDTEGGGQGSGAGGHSDTESEAGGRGGV